MRVGDWVEFVSITNKDGSELAEDNWRRKLVGKIRLCMLVGGFGRVQPVYKYDVEMKDGEVTYVNLDLEGNASVSDHFPIEISPDVWKLETCTSIYTFRVLSDEEVIQVEEAVEQAFADRIGMMFAAYENGPVS